MRKPPPSTTVIEKALEGITKAVRHLLISIVFCAGTLYLLYTFELSVAISKKHQSVKQSASMLEKGSKFVGKAVGVYKTVKGVF